MSGTSRPLYRLLQSRGAVFQQELEAAVELPAHFEMGLAELIARGLITSDSYSGLRQLIVPPSRREHRVQTAGRWSLFHGTTPPSLASFDQAEFAAKQLLTRYGVIFRMLLEREKIPVPWRDMARALRRLELRGEVRGGRFVQSFSGEQFALPEAARMLKDVQARGAKADAARGNVHAPFELKVSAADPLNLHGILTPDPRVASNAREWVQVV